MERRPIPRRIVWVAAADARGHLMRAHVLRRALAPRGVEVDVLTTSDQGAAFLSTLGTPARVLSKHYALQFDAHHNLDRASTHACVVRYLLRPSRALHDLRRLGQSYAGADLVVNDFHPALFVAPALGPLSPPPPIVHVYGENTWRAIEATLEGLVPSGV